MVETIGLFEGPSALDIVEAQSKHISDSVKTVKPVQIMNGARIELYKSIKDIGEEGGDPVIALQQLVLYKHTLLAMKELYPNSDLVKSFVDPELNKIRDEAHGYMNALLAKMESVAYDAQMSTESLKAGVKNQKRTYGQMTQAHAQAKSVAPKITSYVV